jgi:hypothetical protein
MWSEGLVEREQVDVCAEGVDIRQSVRRDMRALPVYLTNLTNLTKLSIMFFEVHHVDSKDQIADRCGGAS